MELRDRILAAMADNWSPDGTDFWADMAVDAILELPEIRNALALCETPKKLRVDNKGHWTTETS